MARKFSTGYANMQDAVKDNFRKIGGLKDAFLALETGWYNLQHRKEKNMKAGLLNDMMKEDPNLKAQVDRRLNEELGRAKPPTVKTA